MQLSTMRAMGRAASCTAPSVRRTAPSARLAMPLCRHSSGGGGASGQTPAAQAGGGGLMSAVLGEDDDGGGPLPEAESWGRAELEGIPSAVDATIAQDGEAKLSKRQLTEVATEALKLHGLRPMRSVSHYSDTAQLRVRRAGHAENHYELVTHFQRLIRWLHVTPLPASTIAAAAASPFNLKRIRTRGGGGAGPGGAGPGGAAAGDGPEGRERSGTAEDPRRGREVAAASKQREQARQRAAARQVPRGGDSVSAVARRRRIQEISSKPVWQHTPTWEGWLTVPTQTYGVRVKYPTLNAQIPVIQFKSGVFGSFEVESRIHLTLSSDGTVLSQLWEHEGGMVFSSVLALANRGQSIVSRPAALCRATWVVLV